jgi:nucleotide-binding universal stress UspA family protein
LWVIAGAPIAVSSVQETDIVTIQSVLCAIDFSPESTGVLGAALTVAECEGAPLTVLHVLDPLLVQAARIEYEEGVLETSTDKDLRALIAKVAPGLRVDPATVQQRLRIGAPDREILAAAAENPATLLVIGTHGFSGVRRMFFGSTAARVIGKATVPVLAIPPRTVVARAALPGAAGPLAPLAIHRVLVAVDFTTECMHAIREAAALASRWNLTLTLLHAVPTIPGFEQWKTFLDLDQDKRIERARHELELLAREVANERLAVRQVAAGGAVEDVINRVAAEEPGTLVVMGLREPSLLPPGSGATAYRLLCTTSSPILVVPDTTAHARQRPAGSRSRARAGAAGRG